MREIGFDQIAFEREPMDDVSPISPLFTFQPQDPFATSIEERADTLPVETVIEAPTPTVSDPADWSYAAAMNDPLYADDPIANDTPWHSPPVEEKPSEPVIVFNKYEDHGVTEIVPVGLYPVDSYEVPMYDKGSDCVCVTDPCDCDGSFTTQKIDPLPLPFEPAAPPPIVSLPIQQTSVPIGTPVTSLPPIVNVAGQTPTTQQAAASAGDGETALIFGYPWYYAVGAAAVGLYLLSSMDGKK